MTGTRRTVVGALAGVALAGCDRRLGQGAQAAPRLFTGALKDVAPAPVGCAVTRQHLADPTYAALLTRHFSQVTPEWEMKMEYILRPDGGFRFEAPDAIAAFARDHGLRLFGHTLIWYAEPPAAFAALEHDPAAFDLAYRNYITAVVGRYRGQAVGWDVVNEAVTDDGEGVRECLWSRAYGGGRAYIRRALEIARAADPDVRLLINDYNLEVLPKKRAAFLRLVEGLMKDGAPIGGIGTQTHLAADLAPGALAACFKDLASLGLPIHVSELDISLKRARSVWLDRAARLEGQQRLAREVAEAFAALPARQRFAFTLWGLRDNESWLRGEKENPTPPWDEPLAFDDAGAAKPVLSALAEGFAAGAAPRRG